MARSKLADVRPGQHASAAPRARPAPPPERLRRLAPIAGYWLLAASLMLFRPSGLQLLLLGTPLVLLSLAVCARAARRGGSE